MPTTTFVKTLDVDTGPPTRRVTGIPPGVGPGRQEIHVASIDVEEGHPSVGVRPSSSRRTEPYIWGPAEGPYGWSGSLGGSTQTVGTTTVTITV